MMNPSIIDAVEELNYGTKDNLEKIQKSIIPHFIDIELYKRSKYRYDGKYYSVPSANAEIFVVHNIPISAVSNSHPIFIETMISAVKKGYVYPFLLFINGKAVKWTSITIVKDYTYSYLIIKDIYLDKLNNYCAIKFPYDITYGEDSTYTNNAVGLYFDKDGLYTEDTNNIFMRLELKKMNVNQATYTSDTIYMPHGTNQLGGVENILPFVDGSPRPDLQEKIEDLQYGIMKPSSEFPTAIYKVFFNTDSNMSNDMIYRIPNKEKVTKLILSNDAKIDKFKSNFLYEFSNKKTYEQNIKDNLEYIMKYDSSLMNVLYKNRSLIDTVSYTGADLLKITNGSKILSMSRRKYKDLNCYVMIFKNNKLYEKYNSISYNGGIFTIDIDGIVDSDNFEFLFFKYIKNESSYTKINKGAPIVFSNYYDIENCSFFSTEIEDRVFPISNLDLVELSTVKYEVPFTCTKTDNSYEYNVELTNPYYYDRGLSVSHNRQFRYCYYKILKDCVGVSLTPDFRFCHNINKYMVFVNGQKLNVDNLRITIMDKDNPFDELALYLNITLHAGDLIDIFYLPMEINNMVMSPKIPESGDIVIDGSLLKYNLSKDLYLFFINGLKIHTDDILDVSKNKVKIKNDIGTINDLTIIQYIDKIDELYELFTLNDDEWNKAIDELTDDEFDELFNTNPNQINDVKTRLKSMEIPMRSIIFEIYKDFYGEFNTDEISYTYDKSIVDMDNVDKAGNYIINSSNALDESKADLDRSDRNNGEDEKSHYGK